MKEIFLGGWVFYMQEGAEKELDKHKCGKWMYFFEGKEFAAKMCKEAVKTGIVKEAKHSDAEKGVSCFYLNGDDIESHKKVIQFFIDNNLIRKTKTGKLYNISFKFDDQTMAGEYGNNFKGKITLQDFLNLTNGEWLK